MMKVPIITELLPLFIADKAFFMFAFADLSLDNWGGIYFKKKELCSISCDVFLEIKKELSRQVTFNMSSLFFPSTEIYKGFSKTSYKVIYKF